MKLRVYWQDTVDPPPTAGTELPDSCDVVVIGAGITGLSAALHLAREGASVAVLEQHRVGWGASTRNAGMTLIGLKLSPEALVRTYGLAAAQRFYRSSVAAVDFTEEFLKDEAIDCGFHRHGALWAACTPAHFHALVESRDLLAESFEHETSLVPREELVSELGSSRYHGGLLDPLSGGLNPAEMVNGLLATAVESGVTVIEDAEVLGVDRRDGRISVETARGAVTAGEIVAAANGYTPSWLTWLRRRIIPIGSYIVVTEPLGEGLASELIPRNRMVFDTKKFLVYFRLTPDNRLLFGGRTSFRGHDDGTAAKVLTSWMRGVFPQLGDTAVDYAWSGSVAFTFDQMPRVGRREGVAFSGGYCGHGVANGLYLGAELARAMTGKADAPFTDLGHPTVPFYRKRAWFLPIAGAYYRLVDWRANKAKRIGTISGAPPRPIKREL